MEKRDSYIIKATGQIVPVAPKNGESFTMNEVEELIDGSIDVVYDNGEECMLYDKEHFEKLLRLNSYASELATENSDDDLLILGDVLVCKSWMAKDIVAVLQPAEA